MSEDYESRPGEACGVFGAHMRDTHVANLIYFGLFALQHRGQESAGIAVSDGHRLTAYKNMGLISTVFDENKLAGLRGHLGIGHTRYSTTGSSTWENAQIRVLAPISLDSTSAVSWTKIEELTWWSN